MTVTAHAAAKALIAKLALPAGAVNTAAGSRAGRPVINVFVSPRFRLDGKKVPRSFLGFPVVVQERPAFVANAG